jgi:4-aminobutyrate aminotransferase-like enzyme
MAQLVHAMGDVHPHVLKAQLAKELSLLTFERWTASATPATGKTIFCNSGFEAVEAALKTAMLATGRPGVIAFQGGYHGLGYGALNATHREHFRSPFKKQLAEFGRFVPFPADPTSSTRSQNRHRAETGGDSWEQQIRFLLRREKIGAILVEPIQVRGGINIPPSIFLSRLRELCDQHRTLLILDEIYTGFGRTGAWFACEHAQVVPDLICLGKALAGGYPLSACVGRADLMDAAWPPSNGEAIHTSTFLGNPVGCAMALAQLRQLEQLHLVKRSAELGRFLLAALSTLGAGSFGIRYCARGLGLLAGFELHQRDGTPATAVTLRIIKSLLHRGFILLPEGEHANVISFTPPLTISKGQLQGAVNALVLELSAHRRLLE